MLSLVYRHRGPLAAVPVLAAAALGYDAFTTVAAWSVGGALVLAGWATRIWAQGHLGYRLARRKTMTSCGPYAHVRNPIYIGNTLMILGAVIASEALRLVGPALVWCIALYAVVVRYEEQHLVSMYGSSYRRYLIDVPRWRPRRTSGDRPACVHAARGAALLSELHTPLILAPAVMKDVVMHVMRWHPGG